MKWLFAIVFLQDLNWSFFYKLGGFWGMFYAYLFIAWGEVFFYTFLTYKFLKRKGVFK